MVAFLIMSAKFATLGLLEINKDYASQFLSMASPTKFYRMAQIIL